MCRPNATRSSAQEFHPICPGCGASDYEDNRVDERIYMEAARDAHRLRHEGRNADAIDVLSALYAIRIVNFVRPHWLCLSCGAQFDAGGEHGPAL